MPYTPGQLLSIGMLVLIGGMLQGAVGFGFGLFAVPLLVWIDTPLPTAIVLTMTVTFFRRSTTVTRTGGFCGGGRPCRFWCFASLRCRSASHCWPC